VRKRGLVQGGRGGGLIGLDATGDASDQEAFEGNGGKNHQFLIMGKSKKIKRLPVDPVFFVHVNETGAND
jgi:hypothetical protein